MAEKFGFTDDIDANGCVIAKVYYQLLRKTSRKGRLVKVFLDKINHLRPQGLSSSRPVPSGPVPSRPVPHALQGIERTGHSERGCG